MIEVKQAVEIAARYMAELLKGSDVTLEEVELSDDDRFWYITLSALIPTQAQPSGRLGINTSPAAELFGPANQRVYKVLAVNAETGSVRSMKIRQTA